MENTLLIQAAKRGDLPVVQALLAKGANVDSCDRQGTTPLMFAAANGTTEILRTLLQSGANANLSRKAHGTTASMPSANCWQQVRMSTPKTTMAVPH
jgi:uncharacterized protein